MNYLLIPLSAVEPPPTAVGANEASRLVKAKAAYRFRRQRETDVPLDLLGEPGWDMLLATYIADLEGARSPATSICAGAAVPSTTAIRWMKTLERRGMLVRTPDPKDKRRIYVRLSDAGRAIMDRVIDRLG